MHVLQECKHALAPRPADRPGKSQLLPQDLQQRFSNCSRIDFWAISAGSQQKITPALAEHMSRSDLVSSEKLAL